jgi:hypothetical protein
MLSCARTRLTSFEIANTPGSEAALSMHHMYKPTMPIGITKSVNGLDGPAIDLAMKAGCLKDFARAERRVDCC